MKSLTLAGFAALSMFTSAARADLSAFDGDLVWDADFVHGYFVGIGLAGAAATPALAEDFDAINVNMPQVYASCWANPYIDYHVDDWYTSGDSLDVISVVDNTVVFEGGNSHGTDHGVNGCGYGLYCVWAKVRLFDGDTLEWVEVLTWDEDSFTGIVHPYYQ